MIHRTFVIPSDPPFPPNAAFGDSESGFGSRVPAAGTTCCPSGQKVALAGAACPCFPSIQGHRRGLSRSFVLAPRQGCGRLHLDNALLAPVPENQQGQACWSKQTFLLVARWHKAERLKVFRACTVSHEFVRTSEDGITVLKQDTTRLSKITKGGEKYAKCTYRGRPFAVWTP